MLLLRDTCTETDIEQLNFHAPRPWNQEIGSKIRREVHDGEDDAQVCLGPLSVCKRGCMVCGGVCSRDEGVPARATLHLMCTDIPLYLSIQTPT